MNALRHLSRRSIRTINKPRQRMIAVQHRFIHHRSIHHRLSSPYLKANSGFQVSSKRGFSNMHGTHFSWFEWWSRLFFSHWHETKWASSVITVSGGFVCIVCGWCITNSVMRDPEVRLRPHKKAWHVSQSRLNNAGLYKGGAFRWFNPKRQGYLDKIIEEGWEEAPIPKLDDDEAEE